MQGCVHGTQPQINLQRDHAGEDVVHCACSAKRARCGSRYRGCHGGRTCRKSRHGCTWCCLRSGTLAYGLTAGARKLPARDPGALGTPIREASCARSAPVCRPDCTMARPAVDRCTGNLVPACASRAAQSGLDHTSTHDLEQGIYNLAQVMSAWRRAYGRTVLIERATAAKRADELVHLQGRVTAARAVSRATAKLLVPAVRRLSERHAAVRTRVRHSGVAMVLARRAVAACALFTTLALTVDEVLWQAARHGARPLGRH